MTEDQWLAGDDPHPMLRFLDAGGRLGGRRLVLLICGCNRRAWPLLSPAMREAVEAAEPLADDAGGVGPPRDHPARAWVVREMSPDPEVVGLRKAGRVPELLAGAAVAPFGLAHWAAAAGALRSAAEAVGWVAFEAVSGRGPRWKRAARGPPADHRSAAERAEREAQCSLVRDVFGNPFRPVTPTPSWLTSTVVSLAAGIYADRAFDRLPILADALQDAGCTSDDILNHCRDAHAIHARGCWVVDLVLGKQ